MYNGWTEDREDRRGVEGAIRRNVILWGGTKDDAERAVRDWLMGDNPTEDDMRRNAYEEASRREEHEWAERQKRILAVGKEGPAFEGGE